MRALLALAAAVARSLVRTLEFVYESGRWILRAVSGAQPDPVLPATATADAYLNAADQVQADPMPTVSGYPVRSVEGVTLVCHARHIVSGDPAVDLSPLSDEVQIWLASLSYDEMALLARSMPFEAEEMVRGGGSRITGLPPIVPDASEPKADTSAQAPVWTWPGSERPEDPEEKEQDFLSQVAAYHARRLRA